MRLDLFLKKSRLIKRRSVAKQMCDDGFVFINGKKAKSSQDIKISDKISIYFKEKKAEYIILGIPEKPIRKDESGEYFDFLGEYYYEKGENSSNNG